MRERHGMTNTRIWNIWDNMIGRCNNSGHGSYQWYGAKGISVCKRWMTFENFYQDMGDPPTSLHTLDRKKNNVGYCLENCKWSTSKEQGRNRANNHLITFNGETRTCVEWAEVLGINASTIQTRLSRGHSVEIALTVGSIKNVKKGGI
jgi:hypothetical protein